MTITIIGQGTPKAGIATDPGRVRMYRAALGRYGHIASEGWHDGDADRRRDRTGISPHPDAGRLAIRCGAPGNVSELRYPETRWAYALAYVAARFGDTSESRAVFEAL